MQAKQEEKAELEAMLEQVRHVLVNGLLMTLVTLLRYATGAADPLTSANYCFIDSSVTTKTSHTLSTSFTLICGCLTHMAVSAFIVTMCCRCKSNKLRSRQDCNINNYKW